MGGGEARPPDAIQALHTGLLDLVLPNQHPEKAMTLTFVLPGISSQGSHGSGQEAVGAYFFPLSLYPCTPLPQGSSFFSLRIPGISPLVSLVLSCSSLLHAMPLPLGLSLHTDPSHLCFLLMSPATLASWPSLIVPALRHLNFAVPRA